MFIYWLSVAVYCLTVLGLLKTTGDELYRVMLEYLLLAKVFVSSVEYVVSLLSSYIPGMEPDLCHMCSQYCLAPVPYLKSAAVFHVADAHGKAAQCRRHIDVVECALNHIGARELGRRCFNIVVSITASYL